MARRVLVVLFVAAIAVLTTRFLTARGFATEAVELSGAVDASAQVGAELVAIEPGPPARRAVGDPEHTANPREMDPSASTPVGTVRIFGFVQRLSSAGPIEAIHVSCSDAFGGVRILPVDTRSEYSFDGLAPGRYWISARSDSELPPRSTHARASTVVRADTRVDLVMETTRFVQARVLDEVGVDWMPLDVDVIVTRSPPGSWTSQAVDPAQLNRFWNGSAWPSTEFRPVPIPWPDPNFASMVRNQLVLETRRIEPSDTEVAFLLAREDPRLVHGSVRYRLVDAKTREVVTGANVELQAARSSQNTRAPERHGDLPGEATVPLSPGAWSIHVSHPKRAYFQSSFRIEPGSELDLGDIALDDSVTIRGRVVNERGEGVSIFLSSMPCDERGLAIHPGLRPYFAESAQDGSFEMPGHSRSLHVMTVEADRTPGAPQFDADTAGSVLVVDARNGDVDGIELRFVPGVALVICPSGRETSESSYRVSTHDGIGVLRGALQRDGPARVVVAPGDYDVEMWHERDGPRTRVTIHADRGPVRLDMP